MSSVELAERDELNRLLTATGRGDPAAFGELYRRTSAKLFGVCVRLLRDRGEAEDVLQETYTTVWRRAAVFDPAKASAVTWLVTLSRHKAIDRLRQHREELLDDPSTLEEAEGTEPTPAESAESGEEYRRLSRCLEELEPAQRESVRAAFFTGASYGELALRRKVPLGTMKSWIRRSLLQLRGCLGR